MQSPFRWLGFRKTDERKKFICELSMLLGYKPTNSEIYQLAFTHKSYGAKGFNGMSLDFERLEFLGDAVLTAIVSKHLFELEPMSSEGELTGKRAKLIMRKTLNKLSQRLDLAKFVRTTIPKDRFSEDIHGNVFEALVGAVFFDRGFLACEKFVRSTGLLNNIAELNDVVSYKSMLIQWCQKNKKNFRYDTCEDREETATPCFFSTFFMAEKLMATARAGSKKKAEESVSQSVCEMLKFDEKI